MDLGLGGRVVLLTGASRGRGRACALAFAAEGARLALCARGEPGLQAAAATVTARGADVYPVVADVTRADDATRLVEAVLGRYGRVDVLVNNAGAGVARAFADLDDPAWRATFELNLLSAVRLVRALVPAMRAQGGGRVVNVAALSAKRPRLGQIASNATKAALVSLTESLAGELAPDGIRVNAVCPGLIRNARWEERIAALGRARGIGVDEAATALARDNVPLGRLGTADDVAPLVVFLASPIAAGYITGVSVEVDGGLGRCVALRGLS
jgi:3-oxoacyl-[acyl-carrier protein] reductase